MTQMASQSQRSQRAACTLQNDCRVCQEVMPRAEAASPGVDVGIHHIDELPHTCNYPELH